MTADPIAGHVAALEAALRGPRRTRHCMVAEVRAGLRDAAEAYRAGGLPPDRADEQAVRDFGPVGDVAPSFQEELTARQGRRAALVLVLTFPAMLLGWDLLWSTGLVTHGPASTSVRLLAGLQDVTTVLVATAALTLLAITFHRTASPRRFTRAIGLTGTAGALTCGGLSVTMCVASGSDTVALLATNPTAVAAYTVSAGVLAWLVWQSVRTLRVAA